MLSFPSSSKSSVNISWKSKNMKNLKSKSVFCLSSLSLPVPAHSFIFLNPNPFTRRKILSTELYGNGRNTFCRIYMRQNWLCLRSLRQSIIFFMFSSWRLLVCRYEPVMYSQFEVTAAYSQKLLNVLSGTLRSIDLAARYDAISRSLWLITGLPITQISRSNFTLKISFVWPFGSFEDALSSFWNY